MQRLFVLFAALFLVAGCSTTKLMSSSDEQTTGDVTWKSYAEAKAFHDKIEVGRSTLADVSALGLDIENTKTKNIISLDRTTLLVLFGVNVPGGLDYLDDAVKACLKPRENCSGYHFKKEESREEGRGSLFLRVLNFKKESIIYGWNVEMLILVHDGVVVYKQIKGTPNGTERHKKEVHPLGPLDRAGVGGLLK